MAEQRKLKVLVVDDEKVVRDFFKRLLSLMKLDVVDAEDGYRGVELARNEKFDLFFIDVRMPGMDGLEVYRQIRKLYQDAIIIMITGYAVEDILDQAMKEGLNGIIRKPFDINQIKEVIGKFSVEEAKGPFNVLVVDDDSTVLDFFSRFLREKGLTFKLAPDREKALELARQEKFNLVFLDLVIKNINGVDLYKELKGVLPQASVVLITGHPQKAEEVRNAVEVAGCLFKPFEIDGIFKYIEQARAKLNG